MKTAFLALAILAIASVPASAQQNPTGSWTAKTSGPAFNSGAGATDGTYLYIFGGNSHTGMCSRYSPVSNSWTTMAALPVAVNYHCGAYYGGFIYSFGNAAATNPDPILKYSVASNTWVLLTARLTTNGGNAAAAKLGTKIYISGGSLAGGLSMTEFDPATDMLRLRAPIPAARTRHTLVGHEESGKLYLFGRGTGESNYEFDPVLNTWTARAPVSVGGVTTPRQLAVGFTMNSRIYLVAGQIGLTRTDQVLEYNPSTNIWARRANVTQGRYSHAGAAINGKAYITGGYWPPAGHTEEFDPPFFGLPPLPAANVRQSNGRFDFEQGGWTGRQVHISAELADPDPADLLTLQVQIKAEASATWGPVFSSGPQAQGTVTVTVDVPAAGPFDWRYRVSDPADNTPAGTSWVDFRQNAVSPDFQSDQTVPTVPLPIFPLGSDGVTVRGDGGGPCTFQWNPASDASGTAGLTYDVEVARDELFEDREASVTNIGGTSVIIRISARVESLTQKYWRIRATDEFGNQSAFSIAYPFKTILDDGIDHAEGDAGKVCGGSASPHGSAIGLLLVFLVMAMLRHRLFSISI